ncbi:MAG: EamA family transporter [Nocardioides sp.]
MAIALALLSAVAFGVADFWGGLLSRRAPVWAVTFVMQIVACVVVMGFHLVNPVTPTSTAFGWSALAGLANGIGTVFLYRGLATGRMGVVAPVSGALAALVPIAIGVALGERPSMLAWLGVAAAIPGIWFVAQEPADTEASGRTGFNDGLMAGVSFGLLFAFLGQIPDGSGWLPVVVSEAVAAVIVVVVAIAIGQSWLPRDGASWQAALTGVLVAIAMVSFLAATQRGYLSTAAVLSSLYPGFTVLLAAVVLRERIHGLRAVGLALCGVAVALVAVG